MIVHETFQHYENLITTYPTFNWRCILGLGTQMDNCFSPSVKSLPTTKPNKVSNLGKLHRDIISNRNAVQKSKLFLE